MSRRTLTIIFIAGLLGLVVVVGLLAERRHGTVGDVEAIETALVATTTSTQVLNPATSDPPVSDTGRDEPASVPVWSGIPSSDPTEAVFPVGLRLTSIGVEAPIVPTGVDGRGRMAVPNNVGDVAWYRFGSIPGQAGSAVLAAHVDLAGQGPGVFFRLRDVDPGDVVSVDFSDGSTMRFRVQARAVYFKDELPLDTIFSEAGTPVLTLVTCGGGFSQGHYDSNVVVYATPVPDRPAPVE